MSADTREEPQSNNYMKKVEEATGGKIIRTKGGMEALLLNGMTIRNSDSMRRLSEDEETKDEYKIRRKLVQDLIKQKLKGKMFFQSRYSIAGQNYTATYKKADQKNPILAK